MTARSALLELASRGVDVDSASTAAMDPRIDPDEITRLMALLEQHRMELREILTDRRDEDLRAIRQEARENFFDDRLTGLSGPDERRGE
jgi:hypothetical protein